jgi:membrane complex biogenesis BtpA family protein
MVHLRALPGAPLHENMAAVIDAARNDAGLLTSGGVDALLIENYGDVPFHADDVPPETVAALTAAVLAVQQISDLPIGINVLRNDARAALAIALAVGARFIRVNVHTGSMLTDQGWITGRAHETLRTRAALGGSVAVLADVLVKHATPPHGLDVADAARDTWHRGLADALIVTGAATGAAADTDRLAAVRAAVPDALLLVGSGVTADNAATLLAHADGAIVGSAFHRDGRAGAGIDPVRVKTLVDAFRAICRPAPPDYIVQQPEPPGSDPCTPT